MKLNTECIFKNRVHSWRLHAYMYLHSKVRCSIHMNSYCTVIPVIMGQGKVALIWKWLRLKVHGVDSLGLGQVASIERVALL